MRAFFLLALAVLAVSATPKQSRIVGGTETTIDDFPEAAALLYSYYSGPYQQYCVGTILNNRSILTAAECIADRALNDVRVRLGSSFAHSGGEVYHSYMLLTHPNFDPSYSVIYDIGIIRVNREIKFGIAFPGNYPPVNYDVPDNAPLWAVGWGASYDHEEGIVEYYEQLRKVDAYHINLEKCREIYEFYGYELPDHIMCFGDLEEGGRSQCSHDYGGPVFHYMADGTRVVVGVYSWGGCGETGFPSVNSRVTHFIEWVAENV